MLGYISLPFSTQGTYCGELFALSCKISLVLSSESNYLYCVVVSQVVSEVRLGAVESDFSCVIYHYLFTEATLGSCYVILAKAFICGEEKREREKKSSSDRLPK